MERSQAQVRRAGLALVFVLVLAGALACSRREPSGTAGAPTPVPQTDSATATSTIAFRVEVSVTDTPAVESAQGSEPAGPTTTPAPTKTPWPTRAPTSAPVDDPRMAYVPGGEFIFGRDGGREDESPQQTLEVDGFNIDVYPVTNAQYKLFVDTTGHRIPRHWQEGQIPAGKEDHPVVWVSWEDAVAYAEWVGKRLPTEVEWEKAARGTDGRLYPWGNTFDSAKGNTQEAGLKDTSPVGSYPGGASPYGALDMCGNVWEWTADYYDAYRGSVYSLERYGTTYRVLRGGSWFDSADSVMTVTRNSAKPTFTFSTIGFRCAK
ncbi:MAG: formylglycine-generating enzyme family protein [Chloroflexi bacterium]|nr:formylglycine-generating enzyme family protein [Chloroflexota bacterium]